MADDTLPADTFKAVDAGAAGLIFSAVLFQALRNKNLISQEEANAIASRAYAVLGEAGSPGGAKALKRVLGAKMADEA